MNKEQIFAEIDKFDDAEWVVQHGRTRKYIRSTLDEIDRDDLEDLVRGYWGLMHDILNEQEVVE